MGFEGDELRELIERRIDRDRIKNLLLELLRIPTPQTDLYEKEPRIIEFIRYVVKPELDSMGFNDIAIDDMGNLICRVGKGQEGKKILFISYAMNAAPGSMEDPYGAKIVDGSSYGAQGECAWGRGASEQKGGLTAMLSALRIVAEEDRPLPGQVIFITSTAGETGRHDSITYILEKDKVWTDWGIITGPPTIQIGNKGRIDVIMTIIGKACHSSRPWEGINAIEGTMKAFRRLKKFMPYPSDKAHPELGKATLTPTRIESFPKATHTVQDKCILTLDRRLLPGENPDQALQQIIEAIGDLAPYGVTVEKGAFMYPSEIPKDASVARAVGQAVRIMLKKDPQYTYAHQTLDSGYLNKVGIPTINFGSYDFRFAHTDHDIVEINRVVDATKVYAYIALQGGVGY